MPRTLPVAIAPLPEFADHAINGSATVPAAYLLDAMVRAAKDAGAPVGPTITQASFSRFLPANEIERCAFELVADVVNDTVRLTLSSKITLPNGIRRTREHAAFTLGAAVPIADPPAITTDFELPAERVYRELIRFGPRYCNLSGTLRLGPDGAVGTVRSPVPAFPQPSLGCPYLFDSAMHLACVWAQRYAGVVLYPTGFLARTLTAPIDHGERTCVIAPRNGDGDPRSFDLWLLDETGRPCDVTLGLTMAPLATGSAPPEWILHPNCQRSS